jgi:hypothetical protein
MFDKLNDLKAMLAGMAGAKVEVPEPPAPMDERLAREIKRDNILMGRGPNKAAEPAPEVEFYIPKEEGFVQFGEWVNLFRYHSTIVHGNKPLKIDRAMQNRLWVLYNQGHKAKDAIKYLQ